MFDFFFFFFFQAEDGIRDWSVTGVQTCALPILRFRVDGQLATVMTPPLRLKDAITSRLKIMAKLDIAEKRLPQDGRIMIKYKADGKKKELDFRVSTVPTLYGEKVVMRLLDKENLRLDMTKL